MSCWVDGVLMAFAWAGHTSRSASCQLCARALIPVAPHAPGDVRSLCCFRHLVLRCATVECMTTKG